MVAGLVAFKIIMGVLVLGLLIFVHELGHFLLAKYFGVGVLDFSIGFGKKIWQKQVGETRYSIGLIPLGGYVRMVGDDLHAYSEAEEAGETPDMKLQAVGPLSVEQQAMVRDKSRWLLERSFWPKFWIVFAGPAFNIIFAWFISLGLFAFYGEDTAVPEARLGETFEGFPAAEAGLLKRDLVTHVNGAPVSLWKEFATAVRASGGEPVTLTVERQSEIEGNRTLELTLTPKQESEEVAMLLGDGKPGFVIGVQPLFESKPVSAVRAVNLASQHVLGVAALSIKSVALLLQGAVSPKHISGPISIVEAAGDSAEQGAERLMLFIVFLSVSLAILNLLPIPVLDGGHIVFFVLGAILGRPVSVRAQEYATGTGFMILMCLFIFAIGNDLVRLVGS